MSKLAINRLSRKFKTDGILLVKSPEWHINDDEYISTIGSTFKGMVIMVYTPCSDFIVQYIKLGSSVKLQYKSSL